MSWQQCATIRCPNWIRAGLRRNGDGGDGQPLADGRFCWRCRRKHATSETRKAAKQRTTKVVDAARIKFIDPDYRKDPKTKLFCCRCQKDIAPVSDKLRIYLRKNGITAVHPDDVATHHRPDDLGWLPIGAECARVLGKPWTKGKVS